MSEIIRGVTPTFTFIAPEGLDMTLPDRVWVTFSTPDEREIVSKADDELNIASDRVEVFLTQKETLRFTKEVVVQINWVYDEGDKIIREASNKIYITTESNLKNEVLDAERI